MILIGWKADRTIAYLRRQLLARGHGHEIIYLDDVPEEFPDLGGSKVFCRWIVSDSQYKMPRIVALRAAIEEKAHADVAGHPSSNPTNFSKIVHIVQLGSLCRDHEIQVPETFLGNGSLTPFGNDFVVKGVSSKKSIVSSLDRCHRERPLGAHFHVQRKVVGPDIRVHGTASGCIAELIASHEVDYRFASNKLFASVELPWEVQQFCKRLGSTLQVAFYGADFKIAEDGKWYFLEVNSSPAFEGYDRRAAGAITELLCVWDS